MSDHFTVTSRESWGSRLLGSIKSVLFGLVLFVASFPLLFWNEGRAVRRSQSLKEGVGAVVSVPSDAVNTANEGKLVHVSGAVDTGAPLVDEEFNVQAKALKLVRNVEMYQWKEDEKSETKKKLGGGTETVKTYDYRKDWSDEAIDSSRFQKPEGHENPGSFPFESRTLVAETVKVGAFTLSDEQKGQLTTAAPLKVDPSAAEQLPEPVKAGMTVADGRFYNGANPSSPEIGDVRVSFETVNPAQVSLVGVQTAGSFAPYQAKAGDTVLLVEEGVHTAQAMFKTAQDQNTMLTWILRAVGFFLMFFGLLTVFKPISVFADVVPLVGTLLGAGLGFFAFLLAAVLSFLTIAVAWIFVRPLLGIGLLILAGLGLTWLIQRGRAKKAQRAAAMGGVPGMPPPPPPPPMPA